MAAHSLFLDFLVAIAIGALIGLEREYAQTTRGFKAYAGIRTFTLISLLGALCAFFAQQISIWILVAGFIGVIILTSISYYTRTAKIGATTEIATFLVYLLGAMTVYGFSQIALALTIVITLFLYARYTLHQFAKEIKNDELYSTIKFAILAFVILPFLPNQYYGPYGGLNPYIIWLMVVLVTGISFAGYILMRWLGERRGIELTGIVGGIVSSTALTQSLVVLSKKTKNYPPLLFGIIAANSIMFIRVLLIIFVINRPLFYETATLLGGLAAVGFFITLFLWRGNGKPRPLITLSSPFRLIPALQFAAVFGIVLFLTKVAVAYSSNPGLYITSLLSGIVDADAMVLSMSKLAGKSLGLSLAAQAILIAVLTNTLIKAGIAYLFGTRAFAHRLLALLLLIVAAGIGLYFTL